MTAPSVINVVELASCAVMDMAVIVFLWERRRFRRLLEDLERQNAELEKYLGAEREKQNATKQFQIHRVTDGEHRP